MQHCDTFLPRRSEESEESEESRLIVFSSFSSLSSLLRGEKKPVPKSIGLI
jgi:hypothetical protein